MRFRLAQSCERQEDSLPASKRVFGVGQHGKLTVLAILFSGYAHPFLHFTHHAVPCAARHGR